MPFAPCKRVPEAVAAWRDLPVFAVGARTAGLARRAGFARVEAGGARRQRPCRRHRRRGEPGKPTAERAGAAALLCGQDAVRRSRAGAATGRSAVFRRRVLCDAAAGLSGRDAGRAGRRDRSRRRCYYSRETAVSFFRLMAEAGLMDHFRVRRIVCLSEKVATGLPAHLQVRRRDARAARRKRRSLQSLLQCGNETMNPAETVSV